MELEEKRQEAAKKKEYLQKVKEDAEAAEQEKIETLRHAQQVADERIKK